MIYWLVVSFVLGIVFEKIFQFGWSVGALIFIISLAIFFYLKKENIFYGKIILLVGLAFSAGIFRMSFMDVSPNENLVQFAGEKINFEAVISDEPDVRDDSVRYIVESEECPGSKVLLVADRYPEFSYGDKIKVSGRLDFPENFATENGTEFDYVSYLSKDEIHFIIYRPRIEKIGSGEGNPALAGLYSVKNIFVEKIGNVVPEPAASFLGGIIFGARKSLGEDLLQNFKDAGLVHIVVLSGYNIGIIAVGIFYLASFLNRRKLSFVLSGIFILLFSAMVGFGATVIRALVMAFIALLAKFLGRPADALRWLFIAGFLMLVWNPLLLFHDPSFQLSFMATLGLIIWSPFVENFISHSRISKFIPRKFKIREIVSSTVAVQLFVLPILIKMSGSVSPVSFVVNPVVLPLVPWAMAAGALTGAVGIVSKIISWPFGTLAYLISEAIILVANVSSGLPFATLRLGALPPWAVSLWYAFYGFVYLKIKNPTRLFSHPARIAIQAGGPPLVQGREERDEDC